MSEENSSVIAPIRKRSIQRDSSNEAVGERGGVRSIRADL
jgi:hypothetical protein